MGNKIQFFEKFQFKILKLAIMAEKSVPYCNAERDEYELEHYDFTVDQFMEESM